MLQTCGAPGDQNTHAVALLIMWALHAGPSAAKPCKCRYLLACLHCVDSAVSFGVGAGEALSSLSIVLQVLGKDGVCTCLMEYAACLQEHMMNLESAEWHQSVALYACQKGGMTTQQMSVCCDGCCTDAAQSPDNTMHTLEGDCPCALVTGFCFEHGRHTAYV